MGDRKMAIDDVGFTGTLYGFLFWLDEALMSSAITVGEPEPRARADSLATDRLVRRIEMISGGHPDDDELLHRIQRGPLAAYWVSSYAGGLYVYEVPAERFGDGIERPWLLPLTGALATVARARTLVVHRAAGDSLEIDLPYGAEISFDEPNRDVDAPAGVLRITVVVDEPAG